MRVRQLERLLAENGASSAKLDAITRQLRNIGRLPIAGRGPNAPAVTPTQAAEILIALAGSTTGSVGAERLEKLERLRAVDNPGLTLRDALESLLEDPNLPSNIREIRIRRTGRRANILHTDGTVIEFKPRNTTANASNFYVEGVIPADLLRLIASRLAAPVIIPRSAS